MDCMTSMLKPKFLNEIHKITIIIRQNIHNVILIKFLVGTYIIFALFQGNHSKLGYNKPV